MQIFILRPKETFVYTGACSMLLMAGDFAAWDLCFLCVSSFKIRQLNKSVSSVGPGFQPPPELE